jgi:hypothetical protein
MQIKSSPPRAESVPGLSGAPEMFKTTVLNPSYQYADPKTTVLVPSYQYTAPKTTVLMPSYQYAAPKTTVLAPSYPYAVVKPICSGLSAGAETRPLAVSTLNSSEL